MKDKKIGQNVDLIALICVIAIIAAFASQLEEVTNKLDRDYPVFVLIVLGVLSVFLAIKAFTKPEIKKMFTEPKLLQVIISIIAGFIWLVIIKPVGFFTSAYILLNFYSFMMDEKLRQTKTFKDKRKIAASTLLINLCIVLFIYGVFVLFLKVNTPKGLLF